MVTCAWTMEFSRTVTLHQLTGNQGHLSGPALLHRCHEKCSRPHQMDNITIQAFMNRQGRDTIKKPGGGSQSPIPVAKNHLASIKAEHLAGMRNLVAAWLSYQELNEGKWSLYPDVFCMISHRFTTPIVMDMFASWENAQNLSPIPLCRIRRRKGQTPSRQTGHLATCMRFLLPLSFRPPSGAFTR